MFDKIYPTRHTKEHVTENVHVHRAPTDESVKLLAEMEKAARDKIINSTRLTNNGFEAVMHYMENLNDQTREVRTIFNLNGRKLTVCTIMPADSDPEDFIAAILKDVSEKIASEMLSMGWTGVSHRLFGLKK